MPGKPSCLAIILIRAAAAVQCPNVVYKCTGTQVPTTMKLRAIIFFILLLKKKKKEKIEKIEMWDLVTMETIACSAI